MTRRQLQVLDFIRQQTEANRFPPTIQEIADELGVTKVTALDHLRSLENRGLIRRERYKSRSIEILTPVASPCAPGLGEVCPTCGRAAS